MGLRFKFLLNCLGGVVAIATLCGCPPKFVIDKLPLPDNILEDASTAFLESDSSGVIRDYADLDVGDIIAEDFVVAESTDAESIRKLATENSRLFIQLPVDASRRDHVMRSITAAALRQKLHHNSAFSFRVLNTGEVKSQLKTFGRNDHEAKSDWIGIAKKLDEMLGDNDILIVNIDDFTHGVTAEDFFSQISLEHVVAISTKPVDAEAYFADRTKSVEFIPKGLNAGHVFQLAKKRLARSSQVAIGSDIDRLSLMIAKVVGAIDPHGNLGSLGQFLKEIGPTIEDKSPVTDLHDDILKIIASHFKANYQYLVELKLESRSLDDIAARVAKNRHEFSEQARKTNKILQGIEDLLAASRKMLLDALEKSLKTARNQIDDLRNVDLPALRRDILNAGDQNRDDVISETKKNVRNAADSVIKDNREKHIETRLIGSRSTRAIVDEATDTLNRELKDAMGEVGRNMADSLSAAVRRLSQQNASAMKETDKNMREFIAATMKRMIASARDDINSTVEREHGNSVARLMESLDDATTRLKKTVQSESAQALVDISKLIAERLLKTEKLIVRYGDDKATQIETRLQEELAANKSAIEEALTVAIKKMVNATAEQQKTLGKEIGDRTDAIVKRAKNTLMDALAQAEREIKDLTSKEAGGVRDDITNSLMKIIAAQTIELRKHVTKNHEDTRLAQAKRTTQIVADAEGVLKAELGEQAAGIKELVENLVASAIKKIASHTTSESESVTDEIKKIPPAIKKAQNLLAEALQQAEDEIKRQQVQEGIATRDEVAGVGRKTDDARGAVTKHVTKESEAIRKSLSSRIGSVVGDSQAAIEKELAAQNEDLRRNVEGIVGDAIKKASAQDNATIMKHVTKEHEATRKIIPSRTLALVTDALREVENEIKNHQTMLTDDLRDHVSKAASKDAAEIIGRIEERIINMSAAFNGTMNAAVTTLQTRFNNLNSELKKFLDEMETKLGASLIAELNTLKADLADALKTGLGDVNQNTDEKIKALNTRMIAISAVLSDDHSKKAKELQDSLDAASAAIKDFVDEKVTNSIAENLKNNEGIRDDLKTHIDQRTRTIRRDVKKSQQLTSEEITYRLEETNRTVQEETDKALAAIKKIANKRQAAAMLRKLATVVLMHSDITDISNNLREHNLDQGKFKPAKDNIRSIHDAPRSEIPVEDDAPRGAYQSDGAAR